MKSQKTQIMGILNITPDSFSDGGVYATVDLARKRAKEMITEGADIIDIGGESTRPGSVEVDEAEERKRVMPVIKAIRSAYPEMTLSIDTRKANVAKEAIHAGCSIINSLGGFMFDAGLAKVASDNQCTYIIYHIKGEPKTMQTGSITNDDIVKDVLEFFQEQIAFGISQGMKKEQFIIDPGIGFGKTLAQNLEIIRRLQEFTILNVPLAIGVSRKSHLGMLLKEELNLDTLPSTTERLEASLAETAVAVLQGASIVRTHDVMETKRFITVLDKIKNNAR
ncbi:MAG: dihydropteroate synthase [Candidatus Levybacteria bacterium]|nr:dihydropteroate synthase [Candidatus Levybacteria bacterium]